MKSKQLRLSRLKKDLLWKQSHGVKGTLKALHTDAEKRLVVRLGCTYEPWLYEIETHEFIHPEKLPAGILREVHYAKTLQKKKRIVKHLTEDDRKNLTDYDVPFWLVKHRINLS